MANSANKTASKTHSSSANSIIRQPLRFAASKKWELGQGTSGQVASFVIKTVALEAIRRLSRAKCPFLWNGLQGFQLLCYPPFKWLQCWKPFELLVKGMKMISRPMLVISVVEVLSDPSNRRNFLLDGTENSTTDGDSEPDSESNSETSSSQHNHKTITGDESSEGLLSTDLFNQLCKELDTQGITMPERITRAELQRFHAAANGDFLTLLSSVKKTIRWRETYRILSGEELEMWSDMIFWHGLDLLNRPCLIVRLGLGCSSLPSDDRPRFVQAIVSQVEHGVLQFLDAENTQIAVLVDCQGLSSLRIPMQAMRYCCNILQDHFPNVLGCLIVIRLPSVVRVVAQTFVQVLKPATKKKLRIEGEKYHKVLSECFHTLPAYLGGRCTCLRCAKLSSRTLQPITILDAQTTSRDLGSHIDDNEDFGSPSTNLTGDTMMESQCSQTLRTIVVGLLIVWVLVAFIEGIYNPQSRLRFTT